MERTAGRRAVFAMVLVLAGALGVARGGTQEGASPQAAEALKRADAAFRAGYAAMQAGELEVARKSFAETVKLAPAMAEPRIALGAILVQLGRPEEAIQELEQALKLKPGEPSAAANLALAYEARGKQLIAAGDLAGATVELRAAVAGDGLDADVRARVEDELGSVLAQQQMWPEAEAAFREALRVSPDSADARMHLGVVLTREKLYPEAVVELRRAVAVAPGDAQAQVGLGRALAASGDDAGAAGPLAEALRLEPGPSARMRGAALDLAMVEQRLGKQQESIAHFEMAVAQEPKNATALTNLGLALTQTGRAKESIPYFERALVETPNDPVVHEDLGVAYLQQSDFDGAIKQFEAARALDAADPKVHYDLGLAYKLKDRVEDAVKELEEAARLDPSLPDPPYTLGILYMQTGRLGEAATELRAAPALRPENGDGWAVLGSVLKQMDVKDAAAQAEVVAVLRHAIALLPNQPGPHITLAGVLAGQGKRDEATAERKIAADLSRTAVSRQRATFSTNAGNQALARGEIAEAVGRYQEAIAADPDYAEAHRQLAVAFARQGRAAEADAERAKGGGEGKP